MELIVRLILLGVLFGAASKHGLPTAWAFLYGLGTNVVPLVVHGSHHVTTTHNLLISVLRWVVCAVYFRLLERREAADVVFWLIFFFGLSLVLI